MRVVTKLSLGAALLGSLVAFSAGAQANDWDHRSDRDYRHDDYRHDDYHHDRVIEHRVVEERPVYVRERPVVVERPVMMAPPVVYAPSVPSGLNLNFNIPLR